MTHGDRRPVTAVLADVLAGVAAGQPVSCPLAAAAGLVLADDVAAPTLLPPEARAAMDGVAVRSADVAAAGRDHPVRLPLDGASLAGRGDLRPLPAGHVREIATGAPLPPGADAIVRVEELHRHDDAVEVCAPVARGRDVRPAGQDAGSGHRLVAAGTRLGAATLGGLAGAGVTTVCVVPRPRVAVVPTGDEVVAGTTPDAVGPALRHLLTHDGAEVEVAAPIDDDPAAIACAVAAQAETHDLVVTVGGVSVGPRDHAGDLVAGLAEGHAVSLAMRPGRPFAWGRTADGTTVLCLPGTPLAALAATVLLVRPVVARLGGHAPPRPVARPLAEAVDGDAHRRSIVPAVEVDGAVVPVPGHGAADLARMAAASCLVDLPAGTGTCGPGTSVDVWPLP